MNEKFQASTLLTYSSDDTEVSELRRYLGEPYDLSRLEGGVRFPLEDELFVSCWEKWARKARQVGTTWEILARYLPQLSFPIREGMSTEEDYRAATRRGVDPRELKAATGLALYRPEALELDLHPSPAGRIPILAVSERRDFVTLVQALARRNEPVPIPDSQGAAMISGYNDWYRIHRLRERWERLDPAARETDTWGEELARIQTRPELFQDRLIVLFRGPYSGIPASELDLDDDVWLETSLAIRRDHECAHYLTKRLFGEMRNHALDELLADYAGLVAAVGRFRCDWFLRFMGIDRPEGGVSVGRLSIYRGDPPLSDGTFRALRRLLRDAAVNLEWLDSSRLGKDRSLAGRARVLTALAGLRLEELAAPEAGERLSQNLRRISST